MCEEVEAEDANVEDVSAEVGDVCEVGECLACGHGGAGGRGHLGEVEGVCMRDV